MAHGADHKPLEAIDPALRVDRHHLLTVAEVAHLLRTTPKGIYVMVERGQLPGVRRIGRRVLIGRSDLLHFLDHTCASSPKERR